MQNASEHITKATKGIIRLPRRAGLASASAALSLSARKEAGRLDIHNKDSPPFDSLGVV